MGGGLVQLVAYGAQDIYLTSNPQITFFKVVYRRHTNFAMESIEQTFNGTVDFDKRVTATISRNGDLIKDMWLEVVLTGGSGDTGMAPSESDPNASMGDTGMATGGDGGGVGSSSDAGAGSTDSCGSFKDGGYVALEINPRNFK